MLPETIFLSDNREALVAAWQEVFAEYDNVVAARADFFAREADALVSPANSFGIMDGGLDRTIRDTIGGDLQRAVQAVILGRHHGELSVGSAEVVPTGHPRWPYLVAAPTMRVPESVAQTVNAYLAFRAALIAVRAFNAASGGARIRTIVAPGLGTGVGGMDPRRCAAQMRVALDQVSRPARIPSFATIHQVHQKLRSAG